MTQPASSPVTSANNAPGLFWGVAMPVVFVFLWSTGFLGAKYGLPYAEPMTFLFIRYGLAVLVFLVVVVVTRAPWPGSWKEAAHISVSGFLLQVVYLGGVFYAIALGVEAGVTALIVNLQPLIVAALAGALLGERVSARQWSGLALGIIGVALVVWQKLAAGIGTPLGVGLTVVGLAGFAGATLYQKRNCADMPLRSGNLIQATVAAVSTGLFALALETGAVTWSTEFVLAVVWLALVLSVGTFTLLWMLILRGAASRVASYFFLVPAVTALIAWPMFGETFGPIALAGMALTMAGVALVNIPARRKA